MVPTTSTGGVPAAIDSLTSRVTTSIPLIWFWFPVRLNEITYPLVAAVSTWTPPTAAIVLRPFRAFSTCARVAPPGSCTVLSPLNVSLKLPAGANTWFPSSKFSVVPPTEILATFSARCGTMESGLPATGRAPATIDEIELAVTLVTLPVDAHDSAFASQPGE